MNYFEFFDIPVRFLFDEEALRKAFYANSKKYHPDFYTLEPDEKQAEILDLSTLNNQAYHTLADLDKRMRYILELRGILEEEGQNQIPQAFLAEMMELNEALMELEFEFDPEQFASTKMAINKLGDDLYGGIRPDLEAYENKPEQAELLHRVKDYYLKKRYLLRIKENLSKFAPL